MDLVPLSQRKGNACWSQQRWHYVRHAPKHPQFYPRFSFMKHIHPIGSQHWLQGCLTINSTNPVNVNVHYCAEWFCGTLHTYHRIISITYNIVQLSESHFLHTLPHLNEHYWEGMLTINQYSKENDVIMTNKMFSIYNLRNKCLYQNKRKLSHNE